MFCQEIGRWCFEGNTASWRNMVGGDGIAKQCQHPRPFNIAGNIRDFACHVFEIRRILHIGRPIIPAIGQPARCLDGLPFFGAFEYISIA